MKNTYSECCNFLLKIKEIYTNFYQKRDFKFCNPKEDKYRAKGYIFLKREEIVLNTTIKNHSFPVYHKIVLCVCILSLKYVYDKELISLKIRKIMEDFINNIFPILCKNFRIIIQSISISFQEEELIHNLDINMQIKC